MPGSELKTKVPWLVVFFVSECDNFRLLTLGQAFKCCLQDVEFLRIGRSSDLSCSLNLSYTKYGELF